MRLTLSLAAAALFAATLAAPAAAGPDERRARNADRLARFISQAEEQPSRSCINLPSIRSSQIIDENTIVYEVSSKLKYVNRPRGGPCPALRPDRAVVTRSTGSLLCRGDIARVIDAPQGFEFGSCALGDFTPYRMRN